MASNGDIEADEAGPSSPRSESPVLIHPPDIDVRWVHAGGQHLDLLPTPITSAATTYKAFSAVESRRIDERWEEIDEQERTAIIKQWGSTEGEGAPAKKAQAEAKQDRDKDKGKSSPAPKQRHSLDEDQVEARMKGEMPETEDVFSGQEQAKAEEGDKTYTTFIKTLQSDSEGMDSVKGVPVSQDSLFEVSLPTLSLHPVFWAHTGPRVPVIRGTWFVTDETRPCSWELAEELERAYQEIQPWQPSYQEELATAISVGKGGEDKLKSSLPERFGPGLGIIFDGADSGRLITSGAMTYISRTFWSSLRSKSSGTYVYRGFEAARIASGRDKVQEGRTSASSSRRGSTSSQHSIRSPRKGPKTVRSMSENTDGGKPPAKEQSVLADLRQQLKAEKIGADKGVTAHDEALEEEFAPIVDATDDDVPCTDLILVIHGIGQQLATQYESYSFVYAGNQLRQILRSQAKNPALSSIIRSRRCQVLPVQWRASLNLDEQKTQEEKQHGMDNTFTMADITINKSIPVVRELTNSVLLDIPLYMSQHRSKMIEAVCSQANRLYRLWIARNPDFEKNGRVHIIGHSLGSALAANILSNQPTKMPLMEQLPRQVITQTKDRFLFNTSHLFLCGSPLGIFLHLDQTQIMPRKGRERTMNSPQDEALDRSGKFGCMSIDSLYNIFYFTDPIAYQLNAAVDVTLAVKRPPLAITSVTAPLYTRMSEGIGSMARYLPPLPSLPTVFGSSGEKEKVARPTVIRLPSGIEMAGPSGEERLEGTRGERRFSALNPHGHIDFYLPSAGVSEYLDMITAHASYWSDPSFASFLLAEVFSTRLDLMRTGMGLAKQMMPEGTTL